jgi:hypothetical protein
MPKKSRGRPDGSTVSPMTRIMRQLGNPDYLHALLALVIIEKRRPTGVPITQPQAVDIAIQEFPGRFGAPRRIRLTIHIDASGQRFGYLKGEPATPNRDKIIDLLNKGRVNQATLDEYRQWQSHIAALPNNLEDSGN